MRTPNAEQQLSEFKNGVLFTGLFMGESKALELTATCNTKSASKVIGAIEDNVNKTLKYMDDLVPAKVVAPDGQTVYIKNDPMKSVGGGDDIKLNQQDKDYNKAVEGFKNGKGDKGLSKVYTGGRTQVELDDLARIVRDPQGDKGTEFIDTITDLDWDVKSFELYPVGPSRILTLLYLHVRTS